MLLGESVATLLHISAAFMTLLRVSLVVHVAEELTERMLRPTVEIRIALMYNGRWPKTLARVMEPRTTWREGKFWLAERRMSAMISLTSGY